MERDASACVPCPSDGLVAAEAATACSLAHPNLVRAYRYASRMHKSASSEPTAVLWPHCTELWPRQHALLLSSVRCSWTRGQLLHWTSLLSVPVEGLLGPHTHGSLSSAGSIITRKSGVAA